MTLTLVTIWVDFSFVIRQKFNKSKSKCMQGQCCSRCIMKNFVRLRHSWPIDAFIKCRTEMNFDSCLNTD